MKFNYDYYYFYDNIWFGNTGLNNLNGPLIFLFV